MNCYYCKKWKHSLLTWGCLTRIQGCLVFCWLVIVLCTLFCVGFFFFKKKVCFLLNSFLLRIVKFNIESHEGPLNLESLSDWIKPMLHPFHSDCYPGQLASYYGFGGISWEAPSFSSLHTIISSSFFLFFFFNDFKGAFPVSVRYIRRDLMRFLWREFFFLCGNCRCWVSLCAS